MSGLHLFEVEHPNKDAEARYKSLVAIESQQEALLDELLLILDTKRADKWLKRHHAKGLPIAGRMLGGSPLVLLSGEVGCGKTELATTIGSPLARELDRKVVSMETPSDIRGWGRVGEISARITEAFEQAIARVRAGAAGLLILDEADDLATARGEMQAHHEDRAGVNVLIKQIDRIAREKVPLAALMITNRLTSLDPAVTRRASLQLRFERPNAKQRRAVMEHILEGTQATRAQVDQLVAASKPREGVPFSFSDLMVRLVRSALRRALRGNHAFGAAVLLEAIGTLTPSPLIEISVDVDMEDSDV